MMFTAEKTADAVCIIATDGDWQCGVDLPLTFTRQQLARALQMLASELRRVS